MTFADRSFAERLGWREVVVQGIGCHAGGGPGQRFGLPSLSDRLTRYPTTLLSQALADTEVTVTASPGGPTLPPLDIPDASPLGGSIGDGRRGRGRQWPQPTPRRRRSRSRQVPCPAA